MNRLLEPGRIGGMALRNRIVMPPMGTGLAAEDGSVTPTQLDYYEARARGGVGLVIVEVGCVDYPLGLIIRRQLRLDEDRFLPGLKELVARVHRNGAKIVFQLCHGGRASKSSLIGAQPVAPSPIPAPGGEIPRELEIEEITRIKNRFVQAALRAKAAGSDGVEIHAAHAYLLNNFLSPFSNKRQDGYGGELRGRARFLLEIARALREKLGEGFPILCRFNGQEFGIDGITPQDSQGLAVLLEEAGVDALHVSSYGYNHPVMWGSTPKAPGFFLPLAYEIRKRVRIPVIAVGKITPELGERALEEGKADFISMGRALIADPELPLKLTRGHSEDIRPCIGCVECRDGVVADEPLSCVVNPTLGREVAYTLNPSPQPKKALVVGGGPAGMEAARVAAFRGHQVWLYEKGSQLGGQLLIADKPPFKEDITPLTRYLITQLEKAGVKVMLGQEATPAVVKKLKPQVVFLATGSTPLMPNLPGMENKPLVSAMEVLSGRAEVGNRVVVVGGEMVGCEAADFLAERGKQVTVTRRGKDLATKINISPRQALLNRLAQKGVRMLPGISYEGVTQEGLAVRHPGGEKEVIPADTIVMATGAQPEQALARSLEEQGFPVHIIGDAKEPRKIRQAIAEGYTTALKL